MRPTLIIKQQRPLCSISYARLTVISASSVLIGLTVCVTLTIKYHLRYSTSIPCNKYFITNKRWATNSLPNISTAAGHFFPQTFLSRFFFAFYTTQAIIEPILYNLHLMRHLFHEENISNVKLRNIVRQMFVWRIIDAIGTHGVITISNREYFPVHAVFCGLFVLASSVYLTLHLKVVRHYRKMLSHRGEIFLHMDSMRWWEVPPFSWTYKVYPYVIYIISWLVVNATFLLHEVLCWSHIYTAFSAAEYILITMRVIFGLSSCFDFRGVNLIVTKSNLMCDSQNSTDLIAHSSNKRIVNA